MAFKNAYVSIQIFRPDFRPAGANAASGVPVRTKHKLSPLPLATDWLCRQRGHLKVAIDGAVHGLEAKVTRYSVDKIQIDIAVDRPEVRLLARVLAERDLDSAVDGLGLAGAGNVLHINSTIHVVDREVSGHILHVDMP